MRAGTPTSPWPCRWLPICSSTSGCRTHLESPNQGTHCPPQHQPLDLGYCGTWQPPWHRAPGGVGPRGAPPRRGSVGGSAGAVALPVSPAHPAPLNPQSSFAHRPSREVPAWCHEVGDSDSEQAWRVVPVGIAPAPSLQHTAEPLPRDTLGCSGDRHGQRWPGTMAALCGCWGQRDKLQGQSCAGPLTLPGSNTQYTVPPARGGQRVPELAQGATAPAWEEGCHNEEE